jgi:DNA-binding MarR family transcriptional regulator
MPFDPLVANAGRLRILTALAVEECQEFVHLRRRTQLTDGNLAAHAKRLEAAGLIGIDKQFRGGKPVTTYILTAIGRQALESHARRLVAAISHRRLPSAGVPEYSDRPAPQRVPQPPVLVPSVADTDADDDWVD